jgi:hypothetical protein
MYSRDVSIRIMRHACWHLYFGDARSKYPPVGLTDGAAIKAISTCQQAVRMMALSDFYRIKLNKVVVSS